MGHQKGRRDPFAANIADHQPKLIAAELEKIVIVATYVAGLDANGCVFQGRESGTVSVGRASTGRAWRVPIPGLQAMFGLETFGMRAALCFDFAVDGFITQKREGISIRVFEGGGHSTMTVPARR